MNKEFVNYKTALALKELGFDEPCFISNLVGELKDYIGPKESTVPMPLYQQAFRWFREKHNHVGFIQIVEPEYGGEYGYVIYYNPNHLSVHHWNKGFKTYEEAESACLDKLIEIVKDEKQK